MITERPLCHMLVRAAGLWLSMFAVVGMARDTLTGEWGGFRAELAKQGVEFEATYTGSLIEHMAGGFRQGLDEQGLLDFDVRLDLEKLTGWRGAILHAEGLWLHGTDPSSSYIGNFDEVSGIAGVATVRAYQFWLQQQLWNGKLTLRGGWVTLDTDFMISNGANLFSNASFGSPIQTWNGNFSAPVYPVAALGLFAQWQVNDRHELQLGVYDGDSGGERGNLKSSNTRLGSDDGAAFLLEGARTHQIAGRAGTLKLGAGYNTGLSTANASGALVHGNGHLYAILDQSMVPGRGKDAPDRLAFFTRFGHVLRPGRSVVNYSLDAGFTGSGLRQQDQWGVAMTQASFSSSFVAASIAGGTYSTNSETTLELTYKAQLSPWLWLQPTLQHVMNPQDGPPDATLIGLVLGVTF